MDFLKRAEDYAFARGDDYWFNHIYSLCRQEMTVAESVREALMYLYKDDAVVNRLENCCEI